MSSTTKVDNPSALALTAAETPAGPPPTISNVDAQVVGDVEIHIEFARDLAWRRILDLAVVTKDDGRLVTNELTKRQRLVVAAVQIE